MKPKLTMFLLLTLLGPLAAQQKPDPDEVISVPRKYVTTEGLDHQVTGKESSWIGIGKEIGIATRDGLNAVVDTAERFGTTKVGTFVMVMIAWKIVGRQLLGVVLGIPIGIAGICLWMWAARRVFFGYKILDRIEDKTKFYKLAAPIRFDDSSTRALTGFAFLMTLAGWLLAMLIVIFA